MTDTFIKLISRYMSLSFKFIKIFSVFGFFGFFMFKIKGMFHDGVCVFLIFLNLEFIKN